MYPIHFWADIGHAQEASLFHHYRLAPAPSAWLTSMELANGSCDLSSYSNQKWPLPSRRIGRFVCRNLGIAQNNIRHDRKFLDQSCICRSVISRSSDPLAAGVHPPKLRDMLFQSRNARLGKVIVVGIEKHRDEVLPPILLLSIVATISVMA